MRQYLIVLLMLCSLAVPVPAATTRSDDGCQIIVSGKSLITAKADQAEVNLGLEQIEKTADLAQANAAKKMKNILSALQKLAIPKDKIETTWLNLSARYEYNQGASRLVGYTANNQIRVTIDELDKTGQIIDAAINAGANNVNNVSFSLKDDKAQKKQALEKAFADARDKAEALASVSGLKLERIEQIREAQSEITPVYNAGVRAMKVEAAETPIIPGNIEIRGETTVAFIAVKK